MKLKIKCTRERPRRRWEETDEEQVQEDSDRWKGLLARWATEWKF
jgi:hypothetical protein